MSRLLVALVEHSRRLAWPILLLGLLLTGLAGLYAQRTLGVSTDTDAMFSPKLVWHQRAAKFAHEFPQFQNLIVAVVDARIPEEADVTAAALTRALTDDHARFTAAWQPDSSPYLERNAFLFLDQPQLTALLNSTIDAQPFLGQLAADPSLRGLFAALSLVAVGVKRGQADLTPYHAALDAFHRALAAAADDHPQPLSWETLLAGDLAKQAGPYRIVLAKPKLDYGALEPGGAATAALRRIAADLPWVAKGDARVRLTGQIPLSDEEFGSVAQGALYGTIGSLCLIVLWLFLALRSWRLIVPIVLTLFLGLSLTLAFAAAAVGTLNLISLAFAILFIGIAVDFAIQFAVRYRGVSHTEPMPRAALAETAKRVGVQILVAAAAIACGFYAFVPTAFSGVAELGLIAGTGMIIAFLCTLLFLPAALTAFRPRPAREEVGWRNGAAIERHLARHRRPVIALFAILGVVGAALVPHLTFDSDPLHVKDPNTESMRTLRDLMNNPLTNPYSCDIMEPDLDRAVAVAQKLQTLPLVAQALTLASFVPQDQPAKLALIADADNILAPTLAPGSPAAPVTAHQIRMAIDGTLGQIAAAGDLPADNPLIVIGADLKRLATTSDANLLATNEALTQFLPMQLARLRTALAATPVTLADLPASIVRDWQLPDGSSRVQATAKPQTDRSGGQRAFVHEVQSVAPDAGGSAVWIVDTALTIIAAFRDAAIGALAAIAVILFIALRRPLDVALVMAPLLLAAMLTVVIAVGVGMKLNFANIIALPLLLGVGVSFNIYFVMNWRAGAAGFLGTATARAVVFSALTTGTAFGSLALSHHPGTASMGVLLLLSLFCTLLATLIFVPAMLTGLRPGK